MEVVHERPAKRLVGDRKRELVPRMAFLEETDSHKRINKSRREVSGGMISSDVN
jgi:hypothetical protein